MCGENCAHRVQSNMFKLFCVKVAWLYSSGHFQQIYQNMLIMYLLFTARVRSEVSQCGICGGQSGTWTGVSLCSLLWSALSVSFTNEMFLVHFSFVWYRQHIILATDSVVKQTNSVSYSLLLPVSEVTVPRNDFGMQIPVFGHVMPCRLVTFKEIWIFGNGAVTPVNLSTCY
jgi:hypothetical protein